MYTVKVRPCSPIMRAAWYLQFPVVRFAIHHHSAWYDSLDERVLRALNVVRCSCLYRWDYLRALPCAMSHRGLYLQICSSIYRVR